MTHKKARQTLMWMSALLFINHGLTSMGSFTFLSVYAQSFLHNAVFYTVSEMLPLLFFHNREKYSDRMAEIILRQVKEEIFPVGDYCNKFWQNKEDLKVENEDSFPYFLESDEEKTEKAENIENEAETKEVKKYNLEQLSDTAFLLKNFYAVDSTTKINKNELNGKNMALKDLTIDIDSSEPKILIYHTHGSEDFADSKSNSKEETIIGVGDELTRILNEVYHIPTYHDRSFYDMVNGSLDRSKAYTYAGNGVKKILEKYPSIEVIIDLHRDAVKAGTKLVTDINGKNTAKIMFFNGLSRTAKNGDISYLKNPNKEGNLAFSFQMQLAAKEKYPGFTRKIYLKGYRYNLHFKPRSLLIEAGAQTNTKEEVINAMAPLAELLYSVLNRK